MISFWYGSIDTIPKEYLDIVHKNELYGLSFLELPEQIHQHSARHSSDRLRFEMAIENPRLRYLDCDTLMLQQWPELPDNRLPYFANHYGDPDTWAIDFNGCSVEWIKNILSEWTDPRMFMATIINRHWGEWKFLPPKHFKHKPGGPYEYGNYQRRKTDCDC